MSFSSMLRFPGVRVRAGPRGQGSGSPGISPALQVPSRAAWGQEAGPPRHPQAPGGPMSWLEQRGCQLCSLDPRRKLCPGHRESLCRLQSRKPVPAQVSLELVSNPRQRLTLEARDPLNIFLKGLVPDNWILLVYSENLSKAPAGPALQPALAFS